MPSLLTIKSLSKETIMHLIKRAIEFKLGAIAEIKVPVANIFIEPSTRTLISFEKAQNNLRMEKYTMNIENSSFKKNESLYDTLENLSSIGIRNFVIRTTEENYWDNIPNKSFTLINGGDGRFNHPSQALLDAMTIYETFGTLEGLKIAIIGDIENSRVYHSNKDLLEKFKTEVISISANSEAENKYKLKDVISSVDILMFLRVQHERHAKKMDVSEYNKIFGLNKDNLKLIKEGAIYMHPGPINRGIEIAEDISYTDEKSKILEQVANGVYMRMAILEYTCKNT